ncbi:hypothetical protein LZF95_10745 [Algoriphagus sp. AGSA1]|uniref:hypothetical protein n=1 Tax=Algoriphagus sp. AGSA1 TaxID=2907213 RepID=UPI001F271E1A|nr:hypothetical protein [Algoriphagus sp. AGSA1]MCE7055153.1 hypothetical protein [Algoriphagus sp. AGSA1]
MKKMMILTLAVLGMVGFSQTVTAEKCELIGEDQYDCATYLCPSGCVIVACPDEDADLEC